MATRETVKEALNVLNQHDWYWCFSDYTHPAFDEAYQTMRYFVKLTSSINDEAVRKALRELWVATHEHVHANMFHKDEEADRVYETTKRNLMAVILPQNIQKAA